MHATLVKLWTLRRALLFYAVLLALGWIVGLIFRDFTSIETGSMNEPLIKNFVIVALVAYVVMAAIPFVPGAEIGLALLLMFGAEAAPVVYLGMVGALILSFTIARLVPCRPLCRWLRWLGLERASRLLSDLDAAAPAEREQIVLSAVPARLTRLLRQEPLPASGACHQFAGKFGAGRRRRPGIFCRGVGALPVLDLRRRRRHCRGTRACCLHALLKRQKGPPRGAPFHRAAHGTQPLTLSFRALAIVILTTLSASLRICSPVAGLRTMRSGRSRQ